MSSQPSPSDYPTLLADIKQRVRLAQTREMLAVNAELIRLYWSIGLIIETSQQQEGYGTAVVPRLARDLRNGSKRLLGAQYQLRCWRFTARTLIWL